MPTIRELQHASALSPGIKGPWFTVDRRILLVEVLDEHDVAAIIVELRIENITPSGETDSPGKAPPPLILNIGRAFLVEKSK